MSTIRWLDAHTHLDSDQLFAQKVDLLNRAFDAGVQKMLLVNSEADESSFSRTFECMNIPHPVQRFVCIGIHPHHAVRYDTIMEGRLKELLHEPGVVGLGEIGLDFYYNFSPKDVQVAVLLKQLQLARSERLPVIIHCRDAYPQLTEVLSEVSTNWRGMIHCYTGTVEEMMPLLELGFTISFSGIVTFKKAADLQASAKAVPLNRMLVETDAPYLAPVPHRGKTNEPAYVVHTAKFIAGLRKIPEEEFATALHQNFDLLFGTGTSG